MRRPVDVDAADMAWCLRTAARLTEKAWPRLTEAQRREVAGLVLAAMEVVIDPTQEAPTWH